MNPALTAFAAALIAAPAFAQPVAPVKVELAYAGLLNVLHLPGETPRIVDHVTSHVDFVPSVLTWMGITNALGDYTTGESVQGLKTQDWALLAGWQDTALFNEDSITVFKPSRTLHLDMNDHELPKDDPRRVASSGETLQALQEISLFFK